HLARRRGHVAPATVLPRRSRDSRAGRAPRVASVRIPTGCPGGIIAAGDGSRLRAAGFAMPKPLVPVAGVPLIEWVIGNFVAAENPLWVDVDAASRVRALGGTAGTHVTAGMYLFSARARAATPPPLGRLREFLAWLHRQGEPFYAETIENVVDVDHGSDVALAEALAGSGRRVNLHGR